MDVFSRAIKISLVVVFLVGCSPVSTTGNPTSTPSLSSRPVPTVDNSHARPTTTISPTSTSIPSTTPDITRTAFAQEGIFAQFAEKTLIAQYPHVCEFLHANREFSPNRLWMVEICYNDEVQDLMLTFSNKEEQVLWKVFYKDYIPQMDFVPDGGLWVVNWSKDGRYAYFYSKLGGDGGECYVGGGTSGSGLFRIDLQTGYTSSLLHLKDMYTWYTFSFSPTGRRLVYGMSSNGLKILDLLTGELNSVVNLIDFSQSGGYLWSQDGLQFVYSTVTTIDNWKTRSYSLRIVDALDGNERIILKSADKCFVARQWSDNDILTIEDVNENYAQTINNRELIEFDLHSNNVVSKVTVTPFP